MSEKIKRYVEKRFQKEYEQIQRDQQLSAITRDPDIGKPAPRPTRNLIENNTVAPKTPEQAHQQARDLTASKLRKERQNERAARDLERDAAAAHSKDTGSKPAQSKQTSKFREKMRRDRQQSRERDR